MPQGDKSKYTDKQIRQAHHIEDSYEKTGVPEGEAEKRAWSTVNAISGGGKKSGSGRAPDSRTPAERSASANKSAKTRAASRDIR